MLRIDCPASVAAEGHRLQEMLRDPEIVSAMVTVKAVYEDYDLAISEWERLRAHPNSGKSLYCMQQTRLLTEAEYGDDVSPKDGALPS